MGKGFFAGRYNTSIPSSFCFYWNRVLRIVPLYLFSTLLIAALTLPELFHPSNWCNLVLLFPFFDLSGPQIPIGALWSVGTEMEFYLMVPFLYVLFHEFFRQRALLSFILIILLGLLCRMAVHRFLPSILIFGGPALGNMDLFLAGFSLNSLIHHFRGKIQLSKGVTWAFLLLAIYYLANAWFCREGRMLSKEGPMWILQVIFPSVSAVTVSTVILLMELSPIKSDHLVTRGVVRATQWLGLLTYSIYIWHEPLFLATERSLHGLLSVTHSLGILGSCMVEVVLISIPSYYLIELYFDRKKKITVAPAVRRPELVHAD